MKKLIAWFLVSLVLLCAACAEAPVLPVFEWEHNGQDHWQLDASGAVINQGAHQLEDGWLCSICGGEVLDWGDGTFDVTDYDAYGNMLRISSYDEAGELTYQNLHVLTCNEDGIVLKDVEYIDGILYGESIYTVSADGEQIPVIATVWNDDGTTSINKYDEQGNCVFAAVYEENGELLFETISEFALADDGRYYECSTTSRYASGETFYQESNQYGDPLRTLNTSDDGTPWADYTYEYEYKNGSKVWSRQYTSGVLSWEEYFDDEGNCVKDIEYLEDGSSIVTLFNALGDATTSTSYAPDGSILSIKTHEYVYDDEMNQREISVYLDGVLTEDTVFQYDEESGFTGYCQTIYHTDGSREVTEYDEGLEFIRSIVYAADGSVISIDTAEGGEF